MNKIIDGKAISESLLEAVRQEVEALGASPKVCFLRVGEDPASVVYVRNKQRAAEKVGIESEIIVLPDNVFECDVLEIIQRLNNDRSVSGMLVQLPLPTHLNAEKILDAIDPKKDIDGFSAENVGKMVQDRETLLPCTPAGIIELLKYEKISPKGKHVVIVGRSMIVGKPLANLLLSKSEYGNATVTVCHSQTLNLFEITRTADILVAAIGKAHFIPEHAVKDGAVVIDVGMNRIEDTSRLRGYKLVGDVDYENVFPKVFKITPVPGGVGPMTIACLMQNTVRAFKNQNEKKEN